MTYPTARLDTLCRAVNVGHVGPSSMHRDPNGVPFLMGKNVGEGFLITHNIERVTQAFHNSQPKSKIHAGDVVVVRIGKSGQAAKVPEALGEANCSGLVIIKRPSGIDADFLAYYMNSPDGRRGSLSEARGSTRLTLNTGSVAATQVPVPPLAEQHRIVAILDEAFADIAVAKANAEKSIRSARALVDHYARSIFSAKEVGWGSERLGELCELISGQHIDAKDYNAERRGVGYLTGPSDFGLMHPEVTKWTEHPKRMARRDDILITVKGSGVGKVNLLDCSEVAISRQLMAIRSIAINIKYLYAFLSTKFEHFQSISSGAAIPGISRIDVLDLMCPVPAQGEQEAVVQLLDAMSGQTRRLEQVHERKLTALDELKQSLLHQAFTGQLTKMPEAELEAALA